MLVCGCLWAQMLLTAIWAWSMVWKCHILDTCFDACLHALKWMVAAALNHLAEFKCTCIYFLYLCCVFIWVLKVCVCVSVCVCTYGCVYLCATSLTCPVEGIMNTCSPRWTAMSQTATRADHSDQTSRVTALVINYSNRVCCCSIQCTPRVPDVHSLAFCMGSSVLFPGKMALNIPFKIR